MCLPQFDSFIGLNRTSQSPLVKTSHNLLDLPNEILLEIFYRLPGDSYAIWALISTCRKFRDVLVGNASRVTLQIANQKQGIMSILLQQTSDMLYNRQPYKWLGEAYERAQGIELLLDVFESLGAYDNKEFWYRTVESTDRDHARRYLQTIFLASELCALQGTWQDQCQYIEETSPMFVTEFAAHVWDCSTFLFLNAEVFIKDWDTRMGGTESCPLMDGIRRDYGRQLCLLSETFLRYGPSKVLPLFTQQYTDYEDFIKASSRGLPIYAQSLDTPPGSNWSEDLLFSRVEDTVDEHCEQMKLENQEDELGLYGEGYRAGACGMDIQKFKQVVSDNEAWERLMGEKM
jgi:hypothetical protein